MTQSFPHMLSPQLPPIIVGAGNAGLAAAARLSHHGVHAILLEKQDEVGGQLRLSGGAFSAAGTTRQAAQGITDSADQHALEVKKVGHGLGTDHLVELATRHAAQAVDWIDSLGFPFAPETPAIVLGHEPYSVARTYCGDHEINGGRAILETLEPAIDRRIIDVRTNHRLKEILLDPTGTRIVGLVATTPAGDVTIDADMIILATGGYAASRELIQTLQPKYSNALVGCLPHATGDGHRILTTLGSTLIGQETYLQTMGMIEDKQHTGFALWLSEARVIVDANSRAPWEIWVNENGQRFVDESVGSPDVRERALLAQPNLAFWSVWTDDIMHSAPTPPVGPGWSVADLEAESAKDSWLIKAETLEELCALTGLPLHELTATITAYNESEQDPFGRQVRPRKLDSGPFYAIRSVGGMLLSRGGPVVDRELRPLLGEQQQPAVGLYAIGELLGMSQFSGDAFAGGMSVGPALSFGVLIADQIADAVNSEGSLQGGTR
jgi:fumarate reductase flavoprotein subunit